ncbi:Uncharacterized protein Adt_05918 [Abeliophyllum distichum]|uniref:Uncharacterized protein n=1 Tax=Abeliophyllum distichum TaxID=126358 RepID=A0ABD1V5Q2_9LAMI
MAGGLYLWFRHSFGLEMPLQVFQTTYQPRKLPKKKDALPHYKLSSDVVEVLQSIYQSPSLNRQYGFLLNRHRCLIELGLMASKAEFEQGKRTRPTMARLASKKPRLLVPGSSEDKKQKKVIEDLSREENKSEALRVNVVEINEDEDGPGGEVPLVRKRKAGSSSQDKKTVEDDDLTAYNLPPLQQTLSVTATGEVVLDAPPKVPQSACGSEEGAYDSKRKLRELIGPMGQVPDDAVCILSFYPTMEAQAFKKYFSPKWEDFASNGDLEDALEASLAAAVKTTGMQLNVLDGFKLQTQRHKKLVVEASKSEEHKQTLDGLQATVDSIRTAYEQLQMDLKESDFNVLQLTKKLDDANAVQKVTAEALEKTNREKK